MSRDSPRSERDGARNTRIQTGSGHRSVIPYVLCGGLYSLRYCLMFWRGPYSPFYDPGEQGYMESPSRVCSESYSEQVGQFPCTQASSTAVRVVTVRDRMYPYSTPYSRIFHAREQPCCPGPDIMGVLKLTFEFLVFLQLTSSFKYKTIMG